MIAALRGRLSELELTEAGATAVVDVDGVGYEVVVGGRLAAALGTPGDEVTLAVHTHVREGAITLYGFAGTTERRAFRTLIAAHGVGPALALAVLGVHTPAGLARAVTAGDVDALCAVPGVGRKTAQRLVVELAGRLDAPGASAAATGAPPGGEPALVGEEVASALAGLGYGPEEIRDALAELEVIDDVSAALRQALRRLAPRG